MKHSICMIAILLGFSGNAFAIDSSELGSPLFERMEKGCKKYAENNAKETLKNHFNINFWAGGNVGDASFQRAEEASEKYKIFIISQCQNMVSEVLELKLGYAPWQQ